MTIWSDYEIAILSKFAKCSLVFRYSLESRYWSTGGRCSQYRYRGDQKL